MSIQPLKILQKGLNLSPFNPLFQAVKYTKQRSKCNCCMNVQSESPQSCETPRSLNTHELDIHSSLEFHDGLF